MDFSYIDTLTKPKLQPPAKVFKIVWCCLYILMFLSLYIFLKSGTNPIKTKGVWLFITQLALNYMWTPIFFYYHKILWALYISLLLTIVVFLMILCFFQASKISGLLNVPYLFWLCFADYLNYKIWILNR